ncbi:hephaestin-like protein [Gigantopelta aegis]|uniref:hephaestin-like protein n=1 Tax=Gigantopelta aegis TaxID=1735272 RepID=UPI001B88E771|nr:hephaestin-like protein [Gigantopelta aegis]
MKTLVVLTLLATAAAHPKASNADAEGKLRRFYIAALELEWDYAPAGNLVNDDPDADIYIKNGPVRIGSKYTKVLFREFTDDTFQNQKPHPPLLGHLGPVIRAEVGDTIQIVLKNMALTSGRNFSIHPHGVLYDKRSEGALYIDGTSGADKFDDGIPPGQMHVYNWTIPESFAPTKDDENCLAWPYHSHRASERDVATGLVGMLFVCRRGILNDDGTRKDIDREIVLYLDEIAETASFVFEQNLKRCGNPGKCKYLFETKDPDFFTSNRMFNINGYVFGNLPRFEVYEKESVAIHLFSLYEDITNFYISGQTLKFRNHRKSSINYMVGSSLTVTLIAENPGTYLMSSMITPRHKAGMDAFIHILPAPSRTYYIAAEKRIWNYAPSGHNLFLGGSFSDNNTKGSDLHAQADNRIGRSYIKGLYIEYTDSTFTQRKYRPYDEYHLGYLGPVIRAEVGDTIKVVFRNRADRPYSILPHGVTFTKENEGFKYKDPDTGKYGGKIAQPGQTVTYIWNVPDDTAAPTDDDAPCLVHTYHSGVNMFKDLQTGLFGPILICKRGQDKKLNKHRFTASDREFFIFFLTNDENESWYIDENIQQFALDPSSVDKNDEGFIVSNEMPALNGFTWANMPGLNMFTGDHVTWYTFGLGTFDDLHVINMFGQIMTYDGNHVESKTIRPGAGLTLTSRPDRKGKWALVCPSHLADGMMATFRVFQSPTFHKTPKKHGSGRTRVYYIAAVEVEWEYADQKIDPVENTSLLNKTLPGYIFVKDNDKFIGSKYLKAVYREYTDYTFTKQVERGPEEEHLGILGPIIRGEVGDNIHVIFKNMASRPYSIHPQGLFYSKGNEGAEYKDWTYPSRGDRVPPGQLHLYSWHVSPESAPGPKDPNCISWIYYSATDLVKDAQSGLIGPIITCRKGILDSKNKRTDVDREFAVMFVIMNENDSWYLDRNIKKFAPNRVDHDKQFHKSNLMFSVNGKIFANIKGLVMQQDDVVDWHLFGWGTYKDVHPIHFHGQTMVLHTDKNHRVDVIELAPTVSETLQMLADNPGTWIIHCHDGRHIANGMQAVFTILKKH